MSQQNNNIKLLSLILHLYFSKLVSDRTISIYDFVPISYAFGARFSGDSSMTFVKRKYDFIIIIIIIIILSILLYNIKLGSQCF